MESERDYIKNMNSKKKKKISKKSIEKLIEYLKIEVKEKKQLK